jgi:type IV secretion system protein VirB6
MSGCQAIDPHSGLIRGVIDAVDCHTRGFAESGYDQLTSPSSPFQAWLTALLVIYVAVLGYQMLFGTGSTRLSDLPMTALKIGVVLALTANWSVFQTLVFDLASRAPLDLARLATAGAHGDGSLLAGGPLRGLQYTYDQLTLAATALAKTAHELGGSNNAGGAAGAAEALWRASEALFLTTAGMFSAAIVAVGVLTAVGPVFVALFLFDATRGLFVGWLRALLAAAIAPLAGWMAASLMLIVVQSNILLLASQREAGHIDVDTAVTTAAVIFVFSVVQIGLLAAGALIAFSFRLGPPRAARTQSAPMAEREPAPAAASVSRAENLAHFLRRTENGGMNQGGGATAGAGRAAPGAGSAQAYRATASPAPAGPLAAGGARLTSPVRRPSIRPRDGFWPGGGR